MTDNASPDSLPAPQRIDKWLWAARFFKTRSMASAAVSGGKVHADGERVKPARKIRPGTSIRIHRGELEWEITVLELSERRLSAPQAALLYEETEQSVARREAERERRQQARAGMRTEGRPNSKDRRTLERLKRGE